MYLFLRRPPYEWVGGWFGGWPSARKKTHKHQHTHKQSILLLLGGWFAAPSVTAYCVWAWVGVGYSKFRINRLGDGGHHGDRAVSASDTLYTKKSRHKKVTQATRKTHLQMGGWVGGGRPPLRQTKKYITIIALFVFQSEACKVGGWVGCRPLRQTT